MKSCPWAAVVAVALAAAVAVAEEELPSGIAAAVELAVAAGIGPAGPDSL